MRLLDARQGFPYDSAGIRCYTCHFQPLPDDPYIIDWETFIEGEGLMMTCMKCLRDAAELLDFTGPTQTKNLQGRIRNLEQANEALRGEVDAIKSRLLQAVHG